MKIALITPARPRSRHGNRNTAVRWATLMRELGHQVSVEVAWNGRPADLMIALHARRSHASIMQFRKRFPGHPLVLALTGTDLYRDIRVHATARASMAVADRLIVLQEMGLRELAPALRRKTHVVYQSAAAEKSLSPLKSCFEVLVSGHLREEKDPFRAAAAAGLLPPASRICITHIGGAMSSGMAREAKAWMAREPRYRWLGERAHWQALRLLARSRVMVISSRMEGGANVLSEALAAGTPVIASRISGNVGMLGQDYAGFYPLEDEQALARLLRRAEADPGFLRTLRRQCATRARLVRRSREKRSLAGILSELATGASSRPSRHRRVFPFG
jgi:putative glycosyltransferase (TIGR04348 family)